MLAEMCTLDHSHPPKNLDRKDGVQTTDDPRGPRGGIDWTRRVLFCNRPEDNTINKSPLTPDAAALNRRRFRRERGDSLLPRGEDGGLGCDRGGDPKGIPWWHGTAEKGRNR